MKSIKREVILPVSIEDAWEVLFASHNVRKYMGCSLRIKEDQYIWYQEEGDIALLYGDVLEKEIPFTLKLSTYNPHKPFGKEYRLLVEYILEKVNEEQTKVTITQRGFEDLPDGVQTYEENLVGWDYMISNLKEVI